MLHPGDSISLQRDGVEVELCNLNEGLCGDYDPDDPEDINLLRFDVLYRGEQLDDASYCTQVPASTDMSGLETVLSVILNEVREPVVAGHSIKKICERLSWIDEQGIY